MWRSWFAWICPVVGTLDHDGDVRYRFARAEEGPGQVRRYWCTAVHGAVRVVLYPNGKCYGPSYVEYWFPIAGKMKW